MANATPGGKGSATATRHYGATDENDFLAPLQRSSCVPLFSHHVSDVNKRTWPGSKQSTRAPGPPWRPRWANAAACPPPLKASGNLPAHRTPRFTQGRGFQQGGREKTKNICFSPWTHQIHDKTLVNESKKIYYSQEQGNRWSASSSYDYSKLLVTIQTWRGRWLNAVSCMALLSLRLI